MKIIINKIFKITLVMFLILSIYTIPITTKLDKKVLRTNLEIKEEVPTDNIYYLNENNLLIKTPIYIKEKNKINKIKEILNLLVVDNKKTKKGLNGYINKETIINKIEIENNIVKLDFNKELLNSNKLNLTITGIVYSILEIKNIKGVSITIENEKLDNYPNVITKEIGINNEYLYNNRNNIEKVVIYYLENIENNLYYIPVTKYINDNRNKIEIVVDELKNSNNSNLISLIDDKLKILDYEEANNVLKINFNNYLLTSDEETNDRTKEVIAHTMFENFDVNTVIFEVNGEKKGYIIE